MQHISPTFLSALYFLAIIFHHYCYSSARWPVCSYSINPKETVPQKLWLCAFTMAWPCPASLMPTHQSEICAQTFDPHCVFINPSHTHSTQWRHAATVSNCLCLDWLCTPNGRAFISIYVFCCSWSEQIIHFFGEPFKRRTFKSSHTPPAPRDAHFLVWVRLIFLFCLGCQNGNLCRGGTQG